MSERTIVGVCGNCGGNVTVPTFYMSVVPPVPTCDSCRSTARNPGPVIPMNPRPESDVTRILKQHVAVDNGSPKL